MSRFRMDPAGRWALVIAILAAIGLLYLGASQDPLVRSSRLQLLLATIGVLALLATAAPVRSAAAGTLARSRRESPTARATLDARKGMWVLSATWLAGITSLGEIAYLTYTKEITEYTVLGFEYMWRVPIGYALVFSVITVVSWVASRRTHRTIRPLLLAGFFVMAGGLIPHLIKGLHGWAVLLLAAGAAVQLTRVALRHAWLFHQLIRTTVAAAAFGVFALAAGFYVSARIPEQRAMSSLPAVSHRGPNVLLIVLDTVRARSLSLHGYQRATSPNLERFARRGVVFDRAYATAPWTLPSHASLFTGRHPHELSTGFADPLDATYPTLAEALAGYGYLTSAFVANTWYAGAEYGLDRGFIHYDDHETTLTTSFMNTAFGALALGVSKAKYRLATHDNFGRKSAADINRSFLAWLSRYGTERPFFTFLNYCDAHDPYLPPETFALKFSETRPRGHVTAKPLAAWSPGEIRELNDAYDGAIAYLDDQLGRLLDTLDSRGILKNTIVIVTADHGEHFGEHNLLDHVYSLYLPLLHVPLMVMRPDSVDAGRRVGEPVSLRDLPATVFALSGLQNRLGLAGTPLLPRFAGEESRIVLAEVQRLVENGVPDWYPARRGHMKSVLSGEWQYIRNFGDGKEELFNVVNDPDNLRNLAAHDALRLEEYRGYLEKVLGESERERMRPAEIGRK